MEKYIIYKIGVAKPARRLAMGCLLLFFICGSLMAQQTTGQFVIKTGTGDNTHYLSHAGNTLGDATTFSPSVLWTSDNTYTQGGTNKNYYFKVGETPRFLSAPQFQAGGTLGLSDNLPPTNYLNNPESQYYFYKWDGGLGRGIRYYGSCADNESACAECGHVWGDGQCWDVYWVAYIENTWKLSGKYYDLDDVPSGGAKFYPVTITEHDNDTAVVMVSEVPSGLQALENFEMEYQVGPLTTHQVTPIITNYQYTVRAAYTTYVFDGGTHNYYDAGTGLGDQGEYTPNPVPHGPVSVNSYAWTLTGDGATHLSINNTSLAAPTITYGTPNNDGHKTATLTLTVTYSDGSKQRSSATILVKTPCQNPPVHHQDSVVSYVGVTVSWSPTAEHYKVSWKKNGTGTWTSATVGDVSSYTITGLEYNTLYDYKVSAICGETEQSGASEYTFKTKVEPGLMITGSIFGGGRMANVGGKTEVVIVNCDSIGAIYGGNDIAGAVQGADGSTIMLGVNAGDAYATYGTTPNNGSIRVSSVYGGGNGYYAYNGESFVAAYKTDEDEYSSHSVAIDGHVNAMTQLHRVGDTVWTNKGSEPKTLYFPSIVKTAITVSNDKVKIDSIFGGAKNAFVTTDSGNGSSITVNGGIILAVFGGNNWGGGQGYGKHYIEVNKTITNLIPTNTITNTATAGYGRTFGIRSLFGGGNKVKGSTTEIHIKGGQLDDVFAGGNAADVYKSNVTVECSLGAIPSGSSYTFGDTYSNAINPANYTTSGSPAQGSIGENTLYGDYGWDGQSGIYNIHTLYGGNNEAEMERVPTITLTSGSVGTVYGGGNAGDMMGLSTDDGNNGTLYINDNEVKYGTHVVMNSDKIIVDYLYGGCRMSNVAHSTWVELKKGHVGYVYGGCNISGDVGSTRANPDASSGWDYQSVLGATYVEAGVGDGGNNSDVIVYKSLFAGSNGYYNCSSDGIHYGSSSDGIHYEGDSYFDDPTGQYAGLEIPTHNETNVLLRTGVTVKGNVYAGGNLAPVGFDDDKGMPRGYPELVGLASVRMFGGLVEQNVYGGGNMASIYGSNEVRVTGGTIGLALYGGNDRTGQVAEKTNRVLRPGCTVASDTKTDLEDLGVKTYVGVSGNAHITTVYGGGNGAYTYGGETGIQYCGTTPDYPIQPYTFVDININGGEQGGKIQTVYGGGNGVTIRDGATVFLNILEPTTAEDFNNVDTIFGGNNIGDLVVVPDIRLVHGQVGTVYGGCNRGKMVADENINVNGTTVNYLKTIGGYPNIGSYVQLLDTYVASSDSTHNVTAKVTEAVYGGCRMNGVTRNSLVLVEGGDHTSIPLFGGSDISGTVEGFSRVAVKGGTVGNVYGGGNGNYDYDYVSGGNVYKPGSEHNAANLVATGITTAPTCAQSGVDILGGYVGTDADHQGNAFGGGWGEKTRTTGNVEVNIGPATATSWSGLPLIYGNIYGGSALGVVNTSGSNTTMVNFLNGTLHGNVFGGGLGMADVYDGETMIVDNSDKGKVNGKVYVNISTESQDAAKCFIDLRDANVYGCNNTNGSPKDDVTVNVWKTAYNFSDYTGNNYTSQDGTNGTGAVYAINQVFGGGNQADYRPLAVGEGETSHQTHVYVHNCSNTIYRVFSGGNAAYAEGVKATIEGGRFDYIFGGGNGEVSAANIGTGGTNLLVEAGIINHLFGGSNSQGEVLGQVVTTVNGEKIVAAGEGIANACEEVIEEYYGGSNEANLEANVSTVLECGCGLVGVVYGGCNLANIVGDVSLTIRGGTLDEVYGGSKGRAASDPLGAKAANITGNVTLNLEGGKIEDAFGGSNINGNITGNIVVNVVDYGLENCGLDLTNVYGGGNLTPYTPTEASITSPVVNVIHIAQADGIRGNVFGGAKGSTAVVTANPKVNIGYNATTMSSYTTGLTVPASPRAFVMGNVFGGGDEASVTGNTMVNVYKGEVRHKVVCGSNGSADVAANVSGNTVLNISGGNLCTSRDANVGIYGGCHTKGTVGRDVEVNITGSASSQTTIGSQDSVLYRKLPVNVHGGGYGQYTSVTGNVTVNYGDIDAPQSMYPMLYGDIYGGSALGSVNTNGTNTTTVNIFNGSVKSVTEQVIVPGQQHPTTNYYSGNIFGGGLGQQATETLPAVAAFVNGRVNVNIGWRDTYPSTGLKGKATLVDCNVFGCNNKNGSPQDLVYVDVYQTAHTDGSNGTLNNTLDGDEYAILHVFGGGSEANYAPENGNPASTKITHTYIHGCNNTVKYVYGGGNAAKTIGAETLVEGGRFDEIYGGGNGLVAPANIGLGGIGIRVLAGHVNYLFEGCNKEGIIEGTVNLPRPPDLPGGYCDTCGTLFIDSYYFGDNKAEHIGDMVHTISCDEAGDYNYKYVYAGSRWAVVYGDIKLTVQGGNIRYLFGGSKGYKSEAVPIPADVRRFPSLAEIDATNATNPGYYSTALRNYVDAHPEVVDKGGNIELVVQGGVIGEIIGGCDELGNVEGKITVVVDDAGNTTCPLEVGNVYGACNETGYTPTHPNYLPTNPNAIATPKVCVLNATIGGEDLEFGYTIPHLVESFEGNVFGGGDIGNIASNPKVIIGDGTAGNQVTIKGNVYGGGNEGGVNGSPEVIIVPESHTLRVSPPTGNGTITVRNTLITSQTDIEIGEDIDLPIVATPAPATLAGGYAFDHWTVTGMGSSVSNTSSATSTFTMGTDAATLTASFTEVPAHQLYLTSTGTGSGSFMVNGVEYTGPVWVAEGASVTVKATAATGSLFSGWTVAGTGASVNNASSSITTFTMGTTDATMTATFVSSGEGRSQNNNTNSER